MVIFWKMPKKRCDFSGGRRNTSAKTPCYCRYLFFAGAQNGGSEGILTAFEAQNINLSETELAILSACNTGAGKIINGEGVFDCAKR